jgi:2-hydroxychromene-2-carboxylate isomerase
MSAGEIDFWVSIGSTYSYLSVMRLADVAKKTGLTFRWRPFSVRSIMLEQNNIPFRGKPVKMAYMWRDVRRRAEMYGLSPRLPAVYPLPEFDLANRIAVLGAQEGWCPDYIRAFYHRWFDEGCEGNEADLSDTLREIGVSADAAIASAKNKAVGQTYEQATLEAKLLGIFGAPTFIVDSEVFWGDDRLEDAIAWLKSGHLRSATP